MRNRSVRARRGPLVMSLVFLASLLPALVSVTPAAAATLFSDGFESGTMSAWTSVTGNVSAVQGSAFAGSWFGQATSAGSSTYARKSLAIPQSEVYVQSAVDVIAPPGGSGGVTLLRLTTASGGAIVSLNLDKALRLQVKNHVAGSKTTSATTLPVGTWRVIQLHAFVAGATSLVEVWVDGTQVTDLTSTASLGTTAVGALLAGNKGSNGGFTLGFDEVVVDTSFIGGGGPIPPDTPTGLQVVGTTSSTASLSWNATAGATGYGVYRDGSKVQDVTTTSFTDLGLSPSTDYGYTVDAFNTAGRSGQSTPVTATTTAGGDTTVVVRTAADIACDPADPNFSGGLGTASKCQQMATSNLLPGADSVLAFGDTQFDCGGAAAFTQSYDPSWGRFRSITFAGIGDNEYNTPTQAPNGTGCTTLRDAAGYFDYFGNRGGSVTATPLPYVSQSSIPAVYSFNLPEGCTPGVGGTCIWHVVALNSNCALIGGCGAGSPMDVWLRQDLADNSWARCTMAWEHVPRFASKASGLKVNDKVLRLWQDYVNGGVDVVLSSSVHFYERYAPQDAFGNPLATGAAEFLIGVGGRGMGQIAPEGSRLPNSEAGQSGTFGVIQFTLQEGSYAWNFMPVPGGTYSDSGSRACT